MADIAITDLTNSNALSSGTGVFDLLIEAVERKIEDQFQQGRLSGTDYAHVYLGGLQAVLQQSVQFLLTEQEASVKADVLAFEKQSKIVLLQAELEKQWGYDIAIDLTTGVVTSVTDTVGETGIIDQQRLELEEKIDLLMSQDAEVIADTIRKDAFSAAQTGKIDAEKFGGIAKDEAELTKRWGYTVTNDLSTGSITALTSANNGEQDYKNQQVQDTTTAVIAGTAKSYAEIALLDQKQISELAQTTNATGGVLQAQQNLYKAQIAGFKGKHENEVLKQMLDTWSIVYSITDGKLLNTDIGVPAFLEKNVITEGGLVDMPVADNQLTVSLGIFDNVIT